jgi:hypothetical protein
LNFAAVQQFGSLKAKPGLLNDSNDVVFAHDEHFFVVDLDVLSGVFAEKNFLADFDVHRDAFAVIANLAGANSNDFPTLGFFLGRFRDDYPASRFLLGFFQTLNEHTITQGSDSHSVKTLLSDDGCCLINRKTIDLQPAKRKLRSMKWREMPIQA